MSHRRREKADLETALIGTTVLRRLSPGFNEKPNPQQGVAGGLSVCTAVAFPEAFRMPRLYDHIDLRVPSLADATPFYEALLPALGFTRRVDVEGWFQYESNHEPAGAFFGVTESAAHVANENRIAFWADSDVGVDRLAETVAIAGARNIEGPMPYEPGYYAVFFEDPFGNRFEVCHRTAPT